MLDIALTLTLITDAV